MARRITTGRGHARTGRQFNRETISISVDDMTADLDAFADKITKDVLAKAAYAGAHELYAEMKLVTPVNTGKLREAIYHVHNKNESNDEKQVYDIGVNKRKAPHWALVEFGTVKMAAQPYIRRAWDSKIQVAIHASFTVLAEEIRKAMNERVAA